MELHILLLIVCIASNISAVLIQNVDEDTKPVLHNKKRRNFDQMQLTHTTSSKADVTQLDTYCIENLKKVLTRHLSKYPRPQARQDANEFDDVFVEIAARGGDLILPFPRTTLTIPQLLIALALLKGAASPGIRGSDISNILVRKGTQAAQFFQTISQAAQGIAVHSSQQLNQANTQTQSFGVTYMPIISPVKSISQNFPIIQRSTMPPLIYSEAATVKNLNRPVIPTTLMPVRVTLPPKTSKEPIAPTVDTSKIMQLVINIDKMGLSVDKLSPQATVWNNNKNLDRLPLVVRLTGFDGHSTNSENAARELVKNISAIVSRVKDQQIAVSMSGHKNNPEVVLMFYPKSQNSVTHRPTNFSQQPLKKPNNFEYEKEQNLENNFQGKPVYWMNMFYPNGKPNINNQLSTTRRPFTYYTQSGLVKISTTIKPTTTSTDSEYYEEDEDYVTSRYQQAIRARQ